MQFDIHYTDNDGKASKLGSTREGVMQLEFSGRMGSVTTNGMRLMLKWLVWSLSSMTQELTTILILKESE